jgi:hypothetical protein
VGTAAAVTNAPVYSACSTSAHVLSLEVHGKCAVHTHKVAIGAQGPQGKTGATGKTGAAGPDGAGYDFQATDGASEQNTDCWIIYEAGDTCPSGDGGITLSGPGPAQINEHDNYFVTVEVNGWVDGNGNNGPVACNVNNGAGDDGGNSYYVSYAVFTLGTANAGGPQWTLQGGNASFVLPTGEGLEVECTYTGTPVVPYEVNATWDYSPISVSSSSSSS